MTKAALFLFNRTPTMPQPWADAGYECWCVDLQLKRGERREGNIIWVGADALNWLPPRRDWRFAACFPPCTDTAISGARWFKDKGLGALIQALTLFKRSVDICELLGCPYLIENPSSTVSTYWREPDYRFDPNEYGDPYTKWTWLWTGGGFTMPSKVHPGDMFKEPTVVEATEGSKMWLMGPSDDRADKRAETPPGFAGAVFMANGVGERSEAA